VNAQYCEYVSSAKRHLFNRCWVDLLVRELSEAGRFAEITVEALDAKPRVSSASCPF
jgi:hypothetical protein